MNRPVITIFCASGGDTKGVYHLGVLQGLNDRGVTIDGFAGVSTGAVVCGYLAQFLAELWDQRAAIDHATRTWLQLSQPPMAMGRIRAAWRVITGKPSIGNPDPLKALLDNHVVFTPFSPVHIGRVSLASARALSDVVEFTSVESYRSAILSSASIPGIAPPVGPGLDVDGGVRAVAPLKAAFTLVRQRFVSPAWWWAGGAPDIRIIASYATPKAAWNPDETPDAWKPKWPAAISCALRAVDLQGHALMQADWNEAIRTNELVLAARREGWTDGWWKHRIAADLLRLDAPDVGLRSNEVDRKKFEALFEAGRLDGWRLGDTLAQPVAA